MMSVAACNEKELTGAEVCEINYSIKNTSWLSVHVENNKDKKVFFIENLKANRKLYRYDQILVNSSC